MTNSSSLESIDRSLRELVELARLEQQNFVALREITQQQQQNVAALGEQISETNTSINALREITQQQANTASLQAENIRSLVAAVGELARSTTELSRDRRSLMETAQRAAQASETAAFVAQRTLEAVRDLIDELRSSRS